MWDEKEQGLQKRAEEMQRENAGRVQRWLL